VSTSNLKAGAVKRFLELHERAFRLEQAGKLPLTKRREFEAAMEICRRGMLPQEIEMLEGLAAKARADVMMAVNAQPFTLDTSKPPYQVQCPVCYANALAPCMSRPGVKIPTSLFGKLSFPKDARVLEHPHPQRQIFWEENPNKRSRAM